MKVTLTVREAKILGILDEVRKLHHYKDLSDGYYEASPGALIHLSFDDAKRLGIIKNTEPTA